ncbi:restriction endonuclease subunit S [Brumimicrobium sp.]|uniref:restriction endonuclease subunit S n=1 Tax=Brumimicrobium sp. TaxID=2029867 RepID=UPI003A8F0ED6
MEELKLIPEIRFPEFEEPLAALKLGDIAKFSKGKGISKADIVIDGEIECVRYGELYTHYNEIIEDVLSKTNLPLDELVLSEKNDVIIPASGETELDIATASCVLKSGIALSSDLNIIKSSANGVFLAYYLNNAKKLDIAKLSQGISVVHLYGSQLKTLKLNLPIIEEQQKIANFLTSIDERIQLLEKKKLRLEEYKKGVMQKIFSQEVRFKDEKGDNFPDWEEKKLGDVFNGLKGTGLSKDKLSEKGKYKCVLYGELYTKYKEVITDIFSSTDTEEGILSKENDLLVPCSTTTSGIDLANVTALKDSNVLIGGDITILRAKKEVDNIFYAYYLSNHKKLELAKFGQGTTIVHLYFNHFKAMLIDIPSVKEQQKIAKFLSSIDKNIAQITQQIEMSKSFKKGLLQKMFV